MAGWNEWVPGTNMTLSEVLDALKSASIGLDVKDKLYWSFFKIVQEAIKEGNANFDVEMAKGVYNTLKARLDASDTDMRNISVDWINKNLGKLDGTFFSDEFNADLNAGTIYVTNLLDKSVTNRKVASGAVDYTKTDFFELDKTVNEFGGNWLLGYLGDSPPTQMQLLELAGNLAVIECEPNTRYSITWDSEQVAFMKIGTSTKKLAVNERIDGAINKVINTPQYASDALTGPTDKYIYISTPVGNIQPYLKVVKATAGFVYAEPNERYPVVPKNISVYSKAEIDDMVSGAEDEIIVRKTTNEIKFYVPVPHRRNIYMGYSLKRTTEPFTTGVNYENTDQWRLIGVREYLNTTTGFLPSKNYQYVNDGEIECAIKVSGAQDFVGGFHGYEKSTFVQLLIDGVGVGIDSLVDASVKKINFIQKSNLIKHGTQNEVIAEHIKYYDITTSDIKVTQKVIWKQAVLVSDNYLGMLPIKRTSDDTASGVQVTNKYFNDLELETKDVSTTSHTQTTFKYGVKSAMIWGESSKVTAEMSVKNKDDGGYFFVQNSPQYNKMYFSYKPQNHMTAIGDVWENEIYFSVNLGQL